MVLRRTFGPWGYLLQPQGQNVRLNTVSDLFMHLHPVEIDLRPIDSLERSEQKKKINRARWRARKRSLPFCRREEDDVSGPLEPWQKAWLAKHRDNLILRVPTMDVVDQLIQRHAMDTSMDIFQRISACHEALRNDRARLLLEYVASQTQKTFWDFQETLVSESCKDLAVRRGDVQEVVEGFSEVELSAAAEPRRPKTKPPPASVENVTEQLKTRYRKRKVPSLDSQVPRKAVSLDELHVNICLLSVEKLDALCDHGGQRKPFGMSSLKGKESSVMDLEDLFNEDERGEVPRMQVVSGLAGSGKTMAFTLKATNEWAKKDRRRPFWKNIRLYFEGSLTDPDWWDAKNLSDLFGLSSFDLTKDEKGEVVEYIRSHADQVLLVADAMDEAKLKVDSFLWRVLTGNCKAVEGLKIIICSRPCEKTSWLARTYLFDRHLEVVGFTDEKIGQFVQTYFGSESQKARDLQAQLVSRADVRSLMHTPLLATMICRRFDSDPCKALPSTQTEVYQDAVLVMLQQSTVSEIGAVPSSILEQLSPTRLHAAVASLGQLAFGAVVKKSVLLTRSELEKAGCLGYAVELGFLSSSPSANMAGRGEDIYSFPHHTMLEFFAAMHAARKLAGDCEKKIGNVVDKLGVDGDLSRFWVFVSGLLGSEQCEALLSALAAQVAKGTTWPENSRRLMLLIDCYVECEDKLPDRRSNAIAAFIASKGLDLRFGHMSNIQAQAVSTVIRRHSTELKKLNLNFTSMDASNMSQITASLQQCQNLNDLRFPSSAFSSENISSFIQIIEKNTDSLTDLSIPVGDDDFPDVSAAVQKCTRLNYLDIGSPSLTNAGSSSVIGVLQSQSSLEHFVLSGTFDDEGFAPIAQELRSMSERLGHFELLLAKLSPAMIRSTLSSLPNLTELALSEIHIGDDGLHQLAQQLATIQRIWLYRVGLTSLSMPTLDMLLHNMPIDGECEVLVKRDLFLSAAAGLDIDDILKSTSLKLKSSETFHTPISAYGLQIRESLELLTGQGQFLYLFI